MDKLLPPDARRRRELHEDRTDNLERRLLNRKEKEPQELIFSLGGVLYASQSGPGRFRYGGTIRSIVCGLLTADPSTGVVIRVRVNGSTLIDVTLAATVKFSQNVVFKKVGGDQDYVTVAVISGGATSAGLTVAVRTA